MPAIACLLLAVVAFVPAGAAATRSVHLRGTAYEFNNVYVLLGGATIHVAEYPALRAVVKPDGTYDLGVPDGTRVTPYITAAGYHTIYLQTFATAGEDLANVNFQTPSDAVYQALAALLEVPVDAAGELAACAIVSCSAPGNVRDLGYAVFIWLWRPRCRGRDAVIATPALPVPCISTSRSSLTPVQLMFVQGWWPRLDRGCRSGVDTIEADHVTTGSRASRHVSVPDGHQRESAGGLHTTG